LTPGATGRGPPVGRRTRGLSLCCALAAILAIGLPEAAAGGREALTISPLENVSPPAIRGPAQVGWTLAAFDGYWSGDPPIIFDYSWVRCLPSGVLCSKIPKATADHYTLGAGDEGLEIKVRVAATNEGGTGSAISLGTAPVIAASAPSLEGTAVVTATQASFLTLTRPLGTSAGNVLIASLSIGVPGSVAIVPPPDWTLVRRDTDDGTSAPLSQATYSRVVAPVEPATYRWSWSGFGPVEAVEFSRIEAQAQPGRSRPPADASRRT
jgi:hypothetical protein